MPPLNGTKMFEDQSAVKEYVSSYKSVGKRLTIIILDYGDVSLVKQLSHTVVNLWLEMHCDHIHDM